MEEAEELERVAEWRLRKLDADPSDAISRSAAMVLGKLAKDVQQLGDSPVLREYVAISNWLGESDDISAFTDIAHDYRLRIGVDRFPEDGEAYLRALVNLAKQVVGA